MYTQDMQDIRNLFENGETYECIGKCLKLVKQIDKTNKHLNYVLFDCYYRIASLYSNTEQYLKGIKYAHQSKLYVTDIESEVLMNWTISYCYYKMNDKRALYYADLAIDLIKDVSERFMLELMVHRGAILEDENLINYALNGLKKTDIPENRMDYMYQDLFLVYKNKNLTNNAIETLHNIKNTKIKIQLYSLLYTSAVG